MSIQDTQEICHEGIGHRSPDRVQALVERVSELEEQLENLKRLETTIERNAALFEALIAASPEGITLTRADGTIIKILKSAIGYDRDELNGHSILDLFEGEQREILKRHYALLRAGKARRFCLDLETRAKDGSPRIVNLRGADMLDNPNVLAVVLNGTDVTALRRSEFAGMELSAVLDIVPFAMFSKDVNGRVRSWNRGAEAMFGYSRDEIVGDSVTKIVPVDLREAESAARERVIQTRQALPLFETVRLTRDGRRIAVMLTLIPLLRGAEMLGIAHVSYPITQARPV